MAALLSALGLITGYFKDLKDLFSDREGRAILLMTALLILIGTIFYDLVEGWDLVDSFYFSVVTLTTVGYGDFSPDTTAGKLFTTIYIFSGLSIITAFASNIAKKHAQRVTGRAKTHAQKRKQNDAEDTQST
jgi:voltage-gated potassium channel Kch